MIKKKGRPRKSVEDLKTHRATVRLDSHQLEKLEVILEFENLNYAQWINEKIEKDFELIVVKEGSKIFKK